jgi:ribonuclease VapC
VIALDTSAVMAILLDEADADRCISAIEAHDEIILSARTLAEVLIVASRRGIGPQATRMIDGLAAEILPVTPATATRLAGIYAKWGKGVHPAGLNFGDCFAYDVAKEHACALLFVGRDFSQIDIESVL